MYLLTEIAYTYELEPCTMWNRCDNNFLYGARCRFRLLRSLPRELLCLVRVSTVLQCIGLFVKCSSVPD